MKNFESGDLVEVINWDSPCWDHHIYQVSDSYSRHSKTYYNLKLVRTVGDSEGYTPSLRGAFSAEYLKYVGPSRGQEIDLLILSVPELASLIAKATDRIIELTKTA